MVREAVGRGAAGHDGQGQVGSWQNKQFEFEQLSVRKPDRAWGTCALRQR